MVGAMWRFLLLFLLSASPAMAADEPFTITETGRSFFTLSSAVAAIGNGEGTIRIAPGHYSDCAVQDSGRVTYRAEKPLTAIFGGGICEGKAVLVLRGRGATVDGLVFEHLRVPDGNGAGIRIEKGSLTVTRSIFRDSEEGILGGGDDPDADILIDRSTFSGLGRCDRNLACAHSIYLSAFRSVTVLRSRFEKGRGGHYVKSRAERIMVADCSFDDSDGRTTNYMIDLPEGAIGRIERNIFLQGADKENHGAFIAVGAEAQRNSSVNLLVANNAAHMVQEANWPTALVADWTNSDKRILNNRLGKGIEEHRRVNLEGESLGFVGTVKSYIKGALRHLIGAARG